MRKGGRNDLGRGMGRGEGEGREGWAEDKENEKLRMRY